MTKNIYCYKCEDRYLGCHDRCDKYTPREYANKDGENDYLCYLGQAKMRMKYSKNLFRRGIRHE